MKKSTIDLKDRMINTKNNCRDLVNKSNQLYDVLVGLRYEGKICFGRNLHEVSRLVNFFNKNLKTHLHLQKSLFLSLKDYLPRLEPAMTFLRAEHRELEINLKILNFFTRELYAHQDDTRRNLMIEKLRDRGIYFLHLLNNHFQMENGTIYDLVEKRLGVAQKKEILNKCLYGKVDHRDLSHFKN